MSDTDASTRTPTKQRPDWHAIREAYLRGGVSLRELAAQTGVSFNTLGKRAVRENWNAQRQHLDATVATAVTTKALQVATERGEQLGITLAERKQVFQERAVAEAVTWLDQIQEAKQLVAANDVRGLSRLLNSWTALVETGRRLHGLDTEPTGNQHLHLHLQFKPDYMPQQQPILDAEVLDAQALPSPEEPSTTD